MFHVTMRIRLVLLTCHYPESIPPNPPVGREKRMVSLPASSVWTDDFLLSTLMEEYTRMVFGVPNAEYAGTSHLMRSKHHIANATRQTVRTCEPTPKIIQGSAQSRPD
jgi:hypothetical protein